MTYTHEWCNLGIEPEVLTIEKIPLTVFPWWLDQLEHNNLVYIEDVNAMPKIAIAEQNQLLRQKVKSLISVPVLIDNKIVAFIGIDSVKDYKVWSIEKINLLHTMAEVVANGINTINLNKKVHYLAYHDSLSGLKNSFSLKLHLDEIVKKAKNNKSNVGVFFIDVDGFKFVNDALGHLQGDKLIRQVGERLSNLCNEDEEVFRVGGDDFVLTSRKCSCDREFNEIANRVLKAFIEPFILNNQAHMITVSIGGSIYPENGVDKTTLLESADMAMYMAKRLGKNRYQRCSSHLKEKTRNKLILVKDLDGAVERSEMELYYQPKVDGHTKEINGLEALIRWNHPTFGRVSPNNFISLAEQTGRIYALGDWVLEAACIQVQTWKNAGFKPVPVSVNISPYQLNQKNLVFKIKEILEKTKVDLNLIELEITESLVVGDMDQAKKSIKQLSEMGLTISIDDYGMECSSLSRIKTMPINKLKIDRSFIIGIGNSHKDEVIIKAIVNTARDLGLDLVAEGVETKQQLDFLLENNCQTIQGYYFYKPMSVSDLEEVLMKIN